MKIIVKAKTKSRKKYVKKISQAHYSVAVHEPPEDGKANRAIIKSIAEYFRIPQSKILLVSGKKSKQKIMEITDIACLP